MKHILISVVYIFFSIVELNAQNYDFQLIKLPSTETLPILPFQNPIQIKFELLSNQKVTIEFYKIDLEDAKNDSVLNTKFINKFDFPDTPKGEYLFLMNYRLLKKDDLALSGKYAYILYSDEILTMKNVFELNSED